MVHPIILDALIQITLLAQQESLTSLRVPVKISEFELVSNLSDNVGKNTCVRQFCVQAGLNSSTVFIQGTDSNWRALASMSNLITVSTTSNAIRLMVKGNNETTGHKESDQLLPLFVEEWTKEDEAMNSSTSTFITACEAISRTAEEIQEHKRITSYIADHTKGNCMSSRLKSPAFLARLLKYAGEAGLLTEYSPTEYIVLPYADCLTETSLESNHEILREDWAFTKFYISKLVSILQEPDLILPHLFPPSLPSLDQPNEIFATQTSDNINFSAERLYTSTVCYNLIENFIAVFASFPKDKTKRLRILEVGAGTGSTTREVLHHLQDSSSTYTFTDVSSSLLNRAEDSLPHVPGVQVDFCVLDLEKDVLNQGFAKEAFDIIIAINVLHATTNLDKVVGNLRMLLSPEGHILIAEQFQPSAFTDIIFGHCKGYWLFQDDIRSDHCLIGGDTWKTVLQSNGYGEVSIVENTDFKFVIIIAKNKDISPPPYIVISTRDKDELANQLVASNKEYATLRKISDLPISIQSEDKILTSVGRVKVILVSHGLIPVGDQEARYPVAGPFRGFSRSLANEILQLDITWVDLDPDEATLQHVQELVAEINNRGTQRGRSQAPFVTYRRGFRYVGRLVPLESPYPMLTLPQGYPAQLRLPESCAMEDLQWDDSLASVGAEPLAENQIQIRVQASGLNFKDISNILKPTVEFASASSIGADICGEVIRVGSAVRDLHVGANVVLAMNMELAPLPNVVQINSSHVALLPEKLTYLEGATLPTAFYTAYHSLITVGKLSRGEWVLIHTASGGVGLVAVQIALAVGANIVCTAGSRRKRAYLTNVLGLTNVTSSRDVSCFIAGVQKAIKDSGVHIVLNSLTSNGWKEASMSVTRKGGRFVEMSKLNIWSHTEVEHLRPDVTYSVVDLSILDEARTIYLAHELQSWLGSGKLKPISYSVFEPPAIISAVEHLQKAVHIGKVVIRWTKDIFNDQSTYLITGGCGELGIELAKLMLLNGAKHLVLVSRRHGGQEAVLSKLRQRDGHCHNAKDEFAGVVVEYGDISTSAGVNEIIKKITSRGMPPLRGIFHAAGVLSDATIPNMTMEKMDLVWAGKAGGAWALHAATSGLNLEHFVLYSSASWVLGGPGQTNSSAANDSLASLADYRHRLGLKATSIAWGQWGEIGMVGGWERTVFAVKPFSTARGINTMIHILRNAIQIGNNVMAAELSDDVKSSWFRNYFKTNDNIEAADLKTADVQNHDHLGSESLDEVVVNLLSKMLRIRDHTKLQRAVLTDVGMDSLMRIELKNKLHTLYGVVVEVSENDTLSEITQSLTKAVGKPSK
ncbi:highly reducing polyketide synthase alt5 [Folsomia candida]|uniref:highly reducing polyketide synthase alt5 n=1 Tax=Folsomia candida TaxID=158441 RepID=UPI000B8F24A6|nr:highly reducing polyketide synthase alt5 [Folsomia candida]